MTTTNLAQLAMSTLGVTERIEDVRGSIDFFPVNIDPISVTEK